MRSLLFDVLIVTTLTATKCLGYFPAGEVFIGTVPGKTYMAIQVTFSERPIKVNVKELKVDVLVTCGKKRVKKETWLTLTDVYDTLYAVLDEEGKDLPKLHTFITKQCGHKATEETLDSYEFKKDSKMKFTRCEVVVGDNEHVILYKKGI